MFLRDAVGAYNAFGMRLILSLDKFYNNANSDVINRDTDAMAFLQNLPWLSCNYFVIAEKACYAAQWPCRPVGVYNNPSMLC